MHECPGCGQACDCDGEDHWYDDAPFDCSCPCWIEDDDDSDEEDDEIEAVSAPEQSGNLTKKGEHVGRVAS